MKRVFFLMLLALFSFVFTSCDPWYPTNNIRLCFKVENMAAMPIYIEFYRMTGWRSINDTAVWNEWYPYLFPLGEEDLRCDNHSTMVRRVKALVNPGFICTDIFHIVYGYVDNWEENSCYGDVSLYNLRDTTMFSFSAYEEGMPFVEHVWMQDTTDMRPRADYVSEFYITITDSNLSAMQKDYSMLEKFPQYYGGQGK